MSSKKQNGSKIDRSADQAKALFQDALKHQQVGDLQAAIEGYNKALRIDPSAPDALNNLGVALRANGQREAAVVAYERLLSFHPTKASTLVNLGNVLRELGRFDDCTSAFLKALALEPKARGALYGLGLVSRDCNQLEESLSYFERALEDFPDDPDLNWDRAQTLLRMGDYESGFEAYEWRWKLERSAPRKFDKPEWDGSALNGRTLFLYGEQGFGDAIQFARFIPELAKAHSTEVILEVRPELVRLLEGQLSGIKQVVARGDDLPEYDCHLPLMSVPRILKAALDDVPNEPYLKPKSGLVSIQSAPEGALNIGLAWAGSPTQANDRNRTFALNDLLPLLQLPQCKFYSLQKGDAAAEIDSLGISHAISPVGPILRDFADTSAVIEKLDLVITADTSVAHLTGAMGKPVWIALSVFHDWRYDAEGSISGWYPQAKVFRQETAGDWTRTFHSMATNLASWPSK
ncbi:MAG: tetratricopeptide repeat protein [Alphaproteobacteria bacterium]|nr:tetratricopeptide repeat protein [Alphaproteobacteria bacterium]